MNGFTYYAPTRVEFGIGAEDKVGQLARDHGATKVLVHFGGASAVRSGLIDRVCASLDEAGLPHVELGGVVPNPRLALVHEGVELACAEGVDFVLAVGGGSVIDSSKSIALGIANGGDPWDFNIGLRTPVGCAPVGAVLTIAAAGSEMSNSCVITNEETGVKRGCNHDICRPKFVIMDPALTLTLPWYQTASGCVDIMMHTMERYFTSQATMQLTDEIAEGLLRTVFENALILHEDPSDIDARAEVMWAGSLSHNGLTGCGNGGNDFSSHALEHELSAAYDVTHGAGLAAIWPSWARYVMDGCLDRFVQFALNVVGIDPEEHDTAEEVALAGIEGMEELYHALEMPTNLHELGLDLADGDLAELAHRCAANCGGSRGAAKILHEEDMLEIYRMANA